jgi:fatty-acid desaturase
MWLQKGSNWLWVYAAHAVVLLLMGIGLSYWLAEPDGRYRFAVQFFFWTVVMRTLFTWHVTWGINSAAHLWGYQNYDTREDSRNNWLFALLTNGEGWHNNHHADPRSARHGHRWWEIDLTYLTLVGLEKTGLVSNLVRPNHRRLDKKTV